MIYDNTINSANLTNVTRNHFDTYKVRLEMSNEIGDLGFEFDRKGSVCKILLGWLWLDRFHRRHGKKKESETWRGDSLSLGFWGIGNFFVRG